MPSALTHSLRTTAARSLARSFRPLSLSPLNTLSLYYKYSGDCFCLSLSLPLSFLLCSGREYRINVVAITTDRQTPPNNTFRIRFIAPLSVLSTARTSLFRPNHWQSCKARRGRFTYDIRPGVSETWSRRVGACLLGFSLPCSLARTR